MIDKLYDAFKHIRFIEHNHTYVDTTSGQEIISVTGLLKKLRPEFDLDYWSLFTALKREGHLINAKYPDYIRVNGENLPLDACRLLISEDSVDDVKYEWATSATIGQRLGTILHNKMESLFYRKEVRVPPPDFIINLKSHKAIEVIRGKNTLENMATELYENLYEKYIPIAMEFVIGDTELQIAGTFDSLFLNKETGELELWDYKTDKEIKFSSKYNSKIKVFDIDDCEFNKYSLQLSIYKYLIEKNTDLKIGVCKIAHFNYRTETITIIPAADFKDQVKEFFENDDNKSIYFRFKTTIKRKRSR